MGRSKPVRITNQWKSMPPAEPQDQIYHQENINEGWHQNYVFDVEKPDIGYKIAMKEKGGLFNNQDGVPDEATPQPVGRRTGDRMPTSKPQTWTKKTRTPNHRETTTVPSKKWSEGQAGTKTHYHQELIRGTQQYGNIGKRKRSYHDKNTTSWYQGQYNCQCNDRLGGHRRLHRSRILQSSSRNSTSRMHTIIYG